ncbi:MAG: ribbon-helix-helix domain-containing protein [Candidatus Eisenbacteria bacterium]
MPRAKSEVISFKADETLLRAMRGVSNRSEFIRSAILAALDSTCPLCGGAGTLSPNQMQHWNDLASDHSVEECANCQEVRLVCSNRSAE